MRKLMCVAGLLAALVLPASAQDYRVEVFTGYSYARLATPSPDPSHLNGWNAAVQFNANSWIGMVADFSGHYGQRQIVPGIDRGINTHSALFGPRVQLPGPFRPFAHALFGAARGTAGVFGSSSSDTAFGMAAGGGLDVGSGRITYRVIQGDYLMNRFFDRTNNNFRLSTGLVFRF